MRKTIYAIAGAACLCISAQAQTIYSIVTCAGEDASRQMNVSWACDTGTKTYVRYTKESDKDWKKARTVSTLDMEEYCTVYDSLYSKTADGTNFYEDARFTKCGVTLGGLKPDTEYKYTIVSEDGETSSEHHFKTAGAKEWSACIISDFHSYAPLPKRLQAGMGMVETVIAHDPSVDWVLHLGDVCAWGGCWSFWKRMYEEPLFERYFWAGLNGNHDNMTRVGGQSADFFRYANYVPRNGYGDQMGVCYHFRYGDALFVMLNNEAMRPQEGFEEAQRYVREVITAQKAARNAPRYIIVCEHYQWFFGESGRTSHYGRWHELFEELGVDLALAGNNHIYVRGEDAGVVYVQTTSSDNERGMPMEDELTDNADKVKFRWTEGGRTVSGVHMTCSRKSITLSLLDRNGVTLDSVEVPCKKAK